MAFPKAASQLRCEGLRVDPLKRQNEVDIEGIQEVEVGSTGIPKRWRWRKSSGGHYV